MREELLALLRPVTEEEQRILDGKKGIERALYTSRQDFTVDSRKMLEKGKLIDVRAHTRFAAFPEHKHNYIEIIYMAEGTTLHRINGETEILLKEGDLLFLNQHARHSIEPAGKKDIAINFIVLPEFFDAAFSLTGEENELRNFLIDILRQEGGENSFLHFRVSGILPVQNLVENMVWLLLHHEGNRRRIYQSTMGLLFLQLMNYTDRLEQHGGGRDSLTAMNVLRYIEENYRTASLSEAAEAEGMSIYRMSRLLKEQTGSAFKELLQTKRFQKAAQLLAESSLSVGEVIGAVGYDNTSYFFRTFRSRYHMSPRQYRMSANKDAKKTRTDLADREETQ